MSRHIRARVLLVAGLVSLATACGSTVQLSSSVPGEAGEGALGAPGSAMEGPAPGASSPGGTSTQGTTGGVAAPSAGADASTSAGAGSTGTTGSTPGQTAPGDAVALPGVTKSTITVGVVAADPSTSETFENAGYKEASLGNEPANWRAMAKEINDHGGIAGRRLELVFYLVNLTESPATQGQAACTSFTEDNQVAAVLSGYYYAPAHRCLSQKGVPSLLGTNYGVDGELAREMPAVVAWATPLLDRIAGVLPGAFQRLGKLRSGTTAGIIVTDSAPYLRSEARLRSALTSQGVTLVTEKIRDSDSGDYSGAVNDASRAVLRFRSEGVTEVMFLSHNAFEPTVFMQAASSQGYEPTYLLSSQQYPGTLAGLVPASQLDGAVGVGWAPALDLSSGYDTSPRAQACLAAFKKQGITFGSAVETAAGLLACDGVELLDRAAERPGGLTNGDALLAAARDGRAGFVSAVNFKTTFPSGRPDGVAAYRSMAFSGGCGCFNYQGAVTNWP